MLAIFGPQLIEFAIKVICSSLLVLLIMNQFSIFSGQEWLVVLSLLMITCVIGFFLALLFHPTLLNRFSFIKKLGPAKKVFFLFQLMRDNSNIMVKKLPIILLLTLGSWFTKGVEWFLIAKAFGIVVMDPWLDIGFFLLFHPFITFIHFLPLPTLAGTGTGEAAASGILALFGIPLGVGIAFGFLTRTMMIVVDLVGLFAIIPLIKKEKLGNMLSEIDDMENRIR